MSKGTLARLTVNQGLRALPHPGFLTIHLQASASFTIATHMPNLTQAHDGASIHKRFFYSIHLNARYRRHGLGIYHAAPGKAL
jgi:hypothetical protein